MNTSTTELSTVSPVDQQVGKVIDYKARLATLTDEEKSQLKQLTKGFNPQDLTTVNGYAQQLNDEISKTGDSMLASLNRHNTDGEIIALMDELLIELNQIDLNALEPSKLKQILSRLPIIKGFVTSANTLLIKYEKDTKEKVNEITKKFVTAQTVAKNDNTALQHMKDKSILYIQELRKLILAAEYEYEELNAKYQDMLAHSEDYDAHELSNLYDFIDALDKKITYMKTSEGVLGAQIIQIAAQQKNNNNISQKAADIVNNSIPIWKNQLAMAHTLESQRKSMEAIDTFEKGFNTMLEKTSAVQKQVSIDVARASETTSVNIETFRKTTQNIIDMINEVNKIHQEGAAQREAFEREMQEQNQKLHDAIASPNQN